MEKNKAIRKYYCPECVQIQEIFQGMDKKEKDALDKAVENTVDNYYSFYGLIEDIFFSFANIMDDYEASAKKSARKDVNKRLAKLGGFTKEDEDVEIEVGDKEIEIEDKDSDDEKDEEFLEMDESEIEDTDKGCKSRKAIKGMRTSKKRMKMRKEDDDEPNPLDEERNILGEDIDPDEEDYTKDWADFARRKSVKRMKMKKGEDMPADADDFKEDNQKGSGSAGSDMPEDADDNQNDNDAGTGNAGSELPEDANEQEDIMESARKARIARMKRATGKSAKKSLPPVRKFSVTPGGQPNQESYNQRYSQAPMVREAIDEHMSSRANKSFNEIAMMNERIANLQKSRRNPPSNNGVPKRIR